RHQFCRELCIGKNRCISCRLSMETDRPEPHSLGTIGHCLHCGARIFPEIPTTFCCSAGTHILPVKETDIPQKVEAYIQQWARLLVNYGREVNQLCSLSAVGVRGPQIAQGGISEMHNSSCFATVQGRCYHFPLFQQGRRSHPLLGNAISYLR